MCDLSGNLGSEQGGNRPVFVAQNDVGNKHSNTTIVIPLTKKDKTSLPQHFLLEKSKYGFLSYDSTVLCEQLKCIDISNRITRKLGRVSSEDLKVILDLIDKNFRL